MLRPNYLKVAVFILAGIGLLSFATIADEPGERPERLEIKAYSRGNSLTFQNTQPLNFGTFVPLQGGTLQVRPSGELVVAGTVTPTPESNHQNGLLSIQQGLENQEIWIDFAANTLTLHSDTGGAHSMIVRDFVLDSTGDGAQLNPVLNNVKLNPAGQADIAVGATLVVGENQAPGSYSGTIHINLRFQ